jgi:lipopolysaccharide biosynthesis regulator YciM
MYWRAKSAQELATEALTRTSMLAPRSSRVHLLMAELYQERLDFRAAEAEYAKAVDSAPNDQAAHLGLANVYYRLFQDDKARAQLKYVFDVDPTNWQAGFLIGEILVRARQYAEAIPYLQLALHADALSVPRVHSLLSRCYAAQGQLPQALAELKPALPEDRDGVYHYQLYQLYEKTGDHQAAAIALRDSEKLRKQEEQEEELKIEKALDGRTSEPRP